MVYNRSKRRARKAQPLNKTRLYDLATRYVARFATSGAKLETYLQRKLRERGWEGDETGEIRDTSEEVGGDGPDIRALVERFIELGYVDDESYARAKAGGLLRRGYGNRRINQALGQAGIAEEIRQDVAGDEGEQRLAIFTMARKKRFGPFGEREEQPQSRHKQREKQIAALLRAGHSFDMVRTILDMESADAAENWAHELTGGGEL